METQTMSSFEKTPVPQATPERPSRPHSTIVAEGIGKSYGFVNALQGVSLTIPGGQSVAIMGPSGSGKSTLLHCISGIIAPTAGSVSVGGQLLSSMNDAARSRMRLENFGFVFQDGQLIPELSARENVAVPLLLAGMRRSQALQTAEQWLARFGLVSEASRRPGQMSGGQAQRVAIARALAGGPSVIFADEPTGALDQATGQEVMQILTASARQSGATFVVVTHDVNVASWCDRLIEIRDGRIHADSSHNHAASTRPSGMSTTSPNAQSTEGVDEGGVH